MSLDIAQMQEAQAETPRLLHPHKPKQQIGDLIVIGIALRRYTDNRSR